MNTYLSNHGILGQKWGVRRYQNEDGSLTEAGKKRYRDAWDTKYNRRNSKSIRDESEEYLKTTTEYKNIPRPTRRQVDAYFKVYDLVEQDSNDPDFTSAKNRVLAEYRKQPDYKDLSDNQIIKLSNHHFYEHVAELIAESPAYKADIDGLYAGSDAAAKYIDEMLSNKFGKADMADLSHLILLDVYWNGLI